MNIILNHKIKRWEGWRHSCEKFSSRTMTVIENVLTCRILTLTLKTWVWTFWSETEKMQNFKHTQLYTEQNIWNNCGQINDFNLKYKQKKSLHPTIWWAESINIKYFWSSNGPNSNPVYYSKLISLIAATWIIKLDLVP